MVERDKLGDKRRRGEGRMTGMRTYGDGWWVEREEECTLYRWDR